MTKNTITRISTDNKLWKCLIGLFLFFWLITEAGAGAFEQSKSIDGKAFAEPP